VCGIIVKLPVLLRQSNLIGERAAAGDNDHRPALIVFFHRVQTVEKGIRAGQAATQFDNSQAVRSAYLAVNCCNKSSMAAALSKLS